MNKYEQLREYIIQRVKEISQAPGGTNSITNFAKESELRLILKYMNSLDIEVDQDRKFYEQVQSENNSLSDSADDEWDRINGAFLYTGIPNFDRAAFDKIQKELKVKSNIVK